MTSLGVRLGGPKTLSFLINADHHTTDSSSSSSSSRLVAFGGGGGLIHRNQFNPKQQQKKVIYNNFRTASAMAVTTPTSCSSSPPVQVDPILGTDICSSCPTSRRRANRVGVDQQESPPPISAEKLDDWIKNSISEIVRNIGDSPLLVHLYSSKNKGYSSSSITSRIEKAEPGSWTNIARRWEEGSSVPDGIILVEQLNQEEEEEEEVFGNSNNTKTWGLVIQGRGVDSASSCYILKTCRVLSSLGFCTHFCLVRAKCFGEIPNLQLKNSWLLNH